MDDTGNTAQERGGGAYVYGEGTFSVSDVPDITGNKAGGKDSNVYPPSGKTIGITVTVTNPQSGATIGYSQDGANYSEKKIEYTVAQSATVTVSDQTVKAGGEIKTGVNQVKATGLLKGNQRGCRDATAPLVSL